MDCLALETLLVNHERIELIDVRSREEFAAMHIPGARSVPFGELAATKIFRRERPTKERVYVISAGGHARASLATGILRSAGCVNAVPVDGGMKDWVARGFPLQRKRFSISSAADFIPRAALPLMGAGVALLLREFTAATLLLAIAGVLILRPNFPAKTTAKARARTYARCESRLHIWRKRRNRMSIELRDGSMPAFSSAPTCNPA